jgi:mannose-6-phosphate isomerase-like protein (cupin superfamily)
VRARIDGEHLHEGEALAELGGARRVVRKHDVVFVPPGVRHAIYNTGLADLTFIVVNSPPEDADDRRSDPALQQLANEPLD